VTPSHRDRSGDGGSFDDDGAEEAAWRGEPRAAGRGAGGKRRVPRWKIALGAAGAAIVLTSPLWGPPIMRQMDFFRIRRVEILGAKYLTSAEILGRLGVDTTMSVWDPTEPLAERIAAHPQVLTAKIRRKLPGTVVVEVTERIPIAFVPTAQGLGVYDERGNALPIDPSKALVDAPVLAARDTALLRLLAAIRVELPDLYARVSEVLRVGSDQLLLRLDTAPVRAMADVTVDRLGEIAPVEADLARRQLRVAEIDLRYRDQVIARIQ
jgi:cell division septal protein FtsQ